MMDKTEDWRDLEAGDVLYSVRGWEKSNIEFFLVTKMIGISMVEIVVVGQDITGQSQGTTLPRVDTIIGEPTRKKAHAGVVKINHDTKAWKLKRDKNGDFVGKSWRI